MKHFTFPRLCFDIDVLEERMEHVDESERRRMLASLVSSIHKLEKALTSVQQNVASTTVVSKRLQALKIGLAALQTRWDNQVYPYSAEETGYVYKYVFPLN